MSDELKNHWETVYSTKEAHEVSWTQEIPTTSLELIHSLNLDKSDEIIDIGGGDSKLVDSLLDLGFENITVLDISGVALKKAQKRLGEKAQKVTWIESNILDFKPTKKYSLWHDRAAFHFLTNEKEVRQYVELCNHFVSQFIVIGTFSTEGPIKCSGLEITQYSEEKTATIFGENFILKKHINENHTTPFNTIQNFSFSLLEKNNQLSTDK